MKREGKGTQLRIFIDESDKFEGKPLYEVIMHKAHAFGLAGVTVLRGVCGYGANSLIHSSKILRLSEDLPIVIEIIDKPAQIDTFLPLIDKLVTEGLIVKKEVDIIAYRHNGGESIP